ncbi:MAG: NAD-dependent epimerase/dehydratase family protein [Dehalococcoidia bacterium]
MRVLITGGTGFLGQQVARELLGVGDDPILAGRALCRIEPALAETVCCRRLDLRDHQAVVDACRGVDAVVHAGAFSAPWGPENEFRAVNIGGTASVIAGCHRHRVRRLVAISSPSVVFVGKDVVRSTEAAPYPAKFLSTYARTKKIAEDLVRDAAGDLETVVLRPKALFGPGDRTLVPRLTEAARRGRLPQVGDGKNLVDLTYVDNAALAVVAALHRDQPVGRTYTITNDEPASIWDLIRRVLDRLGLPEPRPRLPLAVAVGLAGLLEQAAARTGGTPALTRYTALILGRTQTYDITAARRDLDYRPRVSLEDGIARTLAALDGQR